MRLPPPLHRLPGLLAGLLSGATFLASGCASERPPNIVILVADDQDYEHLGFAGHPAAHTPAIDRLAERGVVFTHGFVPMSRCRPAQASLLSGRWPHQSGVYFNVAPDHIDPETSLANRLAQRDYVAFGEGKFWEFDPRVMGFEGYTIRNYETFVREGQEHLFENLEEVAGEQPFLVWWAPMLPHVPHDPPQRHLDAIDREAIVVPDWFEGDPEAYRQAEHLSLAMVAWLDEGVAQLVAKRPALGEYENTLFLFWIDNGWANGLPSKGTAFDKGLRTPFVLTWPEGIEGGRSFSQLVSTVDFHATLLDYAGAEPSSEVPEGPGRSLRPLLEGRRFEPREALFGVAYLQSPPEPDADAARDAYALWARTERWKYILYLRDVRAEDDAELHIQANLSPYPERERGDEDLFDLSRDPYELHDLAEAPEHREVAGRLRAEALRWWRATGGDRLALP